MAARDHEGEKGVVGRVSLQERGVDVTFEMIDAAEGSAVHPGERLGGLHADEERAHEPRPLGHRDAVEVTEGHARLGEGLADHGHDHLEVSARGELRHHAAVGRVDVVLRGDDAPQHLALAVEDGGRRLVA